MTEAATIYESGCVRIRREPDGEAVIEIRAPDADPWRARMEAPAPPDLVELVERKAAGDAEIRRLADQIETLRAVVGAFEALENRALAALERSKDEEIASLRERLRAAQGAAGEGS